MSDDQATDDSLMLAAARGQKHAFEVLVHRHNNKVVRFCRYFLGDISMAEEAAQDVWITLWKHRRRYEARDKFLAYLMTLSRNRCLTVARSKRRRDNAYAKLEQEPLRDAETAHLDDEKLTAALTRIPSVHREAIILRFMLDLDYDTIAKSVGCSQGTARARVFHGLRKVRKQMEAT